MTTSQPNRHDEHPERLMVIVAHPDDADFGPAGVIARWTREGTVAHLVCCTSGDAGALASPATVSLLQHLTVFVMAVFVGFQVVWNVTPALHTPLMSVTNAISGIIVVGGLLGSTGGLTASALVAIAATLLATINIAGGFLVTRRMLAMFRK